MLSLYNVVAVILMVPSTVVNILVLNKIYKEHKNK